MHDGMVCRHPTNKREYCGYYIGNVGLTKQTECQANSCFVLASEFFLAESYVKLHHNSVCRRGEVASLILFTPDPQGSTYGKSLVGWSQAISRQIKN